MPVRDLKIGQTVVKIWNFEVVSLNHFGAILNFASMFFL